jgi:hypothetical protein
MRFLIYGLIAVVYFPTAFIAGETETTNILFFLATQIPVAVLFAIFILVLERRITPVIVKTIDKIDTLITVIAILDAHITNDNARTVLDRVKRIKEEKKDSL